MAWEDHEFLGQSIMSGDKPFDRYSVCLQAIAADYMERFNRKPTTAELLYAFRMTLIANAEKYVLDPSIVDKIQITI